MGPVAEGVSIELLMFRGKNTLLLQLRVGLPGCLVPGEEAGEGRGVGEQQVGSTPETSHPGEAPPGIPGVAGSLCCKCDYAACLLSRV